MWTKFVARHAMRGSVAHLGTEKWRGVEIITNDIARQQTSGR